MIPVSRLVLGTAVFGLPWYGYGSTSRPTVADSLAIVRHASRRGIQVFDTAQGYGDAGALLYTAGIPPSQIITKARLGVICHAHDFRAMLIHNPLIEDLSRVPLGCGVSVYTSDEVTEAQRLGIAPIQAPASCLNRPVCVDYARAPFLQGVLLRSPGRAPDALREVVALFQQIARDANLSAVTLALHAAADRGGHVVFGVSSVWQLDAVLEAAAESPSRHAVDRAQALHPLVDANAALPSLWSVR